MIILILGVGILAYILFSIHRNNQLNKILPYKTSDGQSRAVLITGCDTGFGNLLAKDLDSKGVQVFAGCLTERGVQELKSQCSENLVSFQMDVTSEESINNAFNLVKEKLSGKGLWGIVNNAGIAQDCWVEFTPVSVYKKTLNVNLLGAIIVTKTFVPLLKRLKGRIVNVASIAGLFAAANMSAYASSKFGLEGFSDSLRREMYIFGIKVCIIEPGFMKTAIVLNMYNECNARWSEASPELQKEYGGEAFVEGIRKRLKKAEESCQDPMLVVHAIHSALFSEAPNTRYLVNRGATLIRLLHLLPHTFLDLLLRLQNPLTQKRLVVE